MAKAAILVFFSLFCMRAWPAEILGALSWQSQKMFNKTRVGGLSGIIFDTERNSLWAVSDDRGRFGYPRIYEIKINWEAKKKGAKLDLQVVDVLEIKDDTGKDPKNSFDFEAIAMLPWGNFLLASEADSQSKPRTPPLLWDIKMGSGHGPKVSVARSYDAPKEFNPDATGKQKVGAQNNMGWEGLSQFPGQNKWLAAMEGPLLQEKDQGFAWFVEYQMPEAWVIRMARKWKYPLEKTDVQGQFWTVAEVLGKKEEIFLVLERDYSMGFAGVKFMGRLYEVDLTKATKEADGSLKLSKKLVIDFNQVFPESYKFANYEGITWGPADSRGQRTLLVVSDNNFFAGEDTQWVLLGGIE